MSDLTLVLGVRKRKTLAHHLSHIDFGKEKNLHAVTPRRDSRETLRPL